VIPKSTLRLLSYNNNVIISEPSISFCVICNHVTVTVTCDGYVTITCDIILICNPKSENKKINVNENENKK